MQPLKEKLSDVKMLVAVFSMHSGMREKAFSVDVLLIIKFLASYHTKQISALKMRSTGRFNSRSMTCTPAFSIARIFWYELLRDISTSLQRFWVLTMITMLGKEGVYKSLSSDFMGTSIPDSVFDIWQGSTLCVVPKDTIQPLFSTMGIKFRSPTTWWLRKPSCKADID